MHPTAFLNDIPKPVWIIAMVGAFAWSWPIGLGILGYLVGSGRIGRRWAGGPGRWYCAEGQAAAGPAQGQAWGKWGGWGGNAAPERPAAPPSGNAAFDEYRAETLRRLEDEQREFVEYLERLRRAKDKAEFDQFMADRRRPPMPHPDQNQQG